MTGIGVSGGGNSGGGGTGGGAGITCLEACAAAVICLNQACGTDYTAVAANCEGECAGSSGTIDIDTSCQSIAALLGVEGGFASVCYSVVGGGELVDGGVDVETECLGAYNTLDQCATGGLAGQGLTMAQCQEGCSAGHLGAESVVNCLAAASDCDQADLCFQ